MKYFPVFKREFSVGKAVSSTEIAEGLTKIENVRVTRIENQFVQCYEKNLSIFFTNSFLPKIDISLINEGETTKLCCEFHLRNAVQVFYYMFFFLLLVFQTVILTSEWGMLTLPCMIPIFLILYMNLLTFLGLYFQVRRLSQEISWQAFILGK